MRNWQIEEEADMQKSCQWLQSKKWTEREHGGTKHAQEVLISARSIEAGGNHMRQDARSRLCKDAPENIQHITAA